MKRENQFMCIEDESRTLFYDYNKKQWVLKKDYTGEWHPATFPCSSYRAALRHIKKHNEIPIGTKLILVSWYSGFDRIITKK